MTTTTLAEHLEKVRYFVDIAEAGSLAKAAKKLRVSQPTLSHNLKVLEKVLGLTLLFRSSHGVELTDPGARLYKYGKKLLTETSLLEQELHLQDDSQIKEISLGTKEPLAVYLWPHYLKEMELDYPSIEVNLQIRRTNAELVELLLLQKLDMLMIAQPPLTENIISFDIFKERFGIYRSPKQKKEQKRLFIFRHALSGDTQTIDSTLKQERIDDEDIRDVDSFHVAKALAVNGLGMALLPKSFAQHDVSTGKLALCKNPALSPEIFGELRICLCFHEKNSKNKKLRAFLRAIKYTHRKIFVEH